MEIPIPVKAPINVSLAQDLLNLTLTLFSSLSLLHTQTHTRFIIVAGFLMFYDKTKKKLESLINPRVR